MAKKPKKNNRIFREWTVPSRFTIGGFGSVEPPPGWAYLADAAGNYRRNPKTLEFYIVRKR